MNQLPGGLSQFTHHLRKALKLDELEHGLLDSGGERLMFFAKLDTICRRCRGNSGANVADPESTTNTLDTEVLLMM